MTTTRSPRSTRSRDDDDSATSELKRFTAFCRNTLTDPEGRPFVLYPEQLWMLRDYFDGCRETLILVAKKNGKTGLAAALSLWHLLTTPFAECYVGAASRDQANRLLDAIHGFVKRSEGLGKRVRLKQREVLHEDNGGFIKVLAADVDTSDGITPTLAICDELHRWKSGELYGLFRDGLGPRNGRMLTISTAGDDEDGPLGQLRSRAYALPGMEHEGAYRYVRQADSFSFHEWALESDADVDDLELVLTCNPAPWVSLSELRERHDSPSTMPWQWKRFGCGIWISGEESAISETEWRKCADPGCTIAPGVAGVTIGIDLGWRWDTSGVVPTWRDDDGIVWVEKPAIIVPPRDGTSTPMAKIWEPIERAAKRWPGCVFVLDPEAGGEQLAQKIDDELPGVTVSTHSQKATAMSRASQRLAELIGERKLRHPDDPELTKHVLAAAAKPTEGGGWRFVKQRNKKNPIDAVIALAMAVAAEKKKPPGEVLFM